jgi:hypothetical protein
VIRSIAIVASVLVLAGCAERAAFDTVYCTSYVPVTYSAAGDTEETKSQIRANNAVWKKMCQ